MCDQALRVLFSCAYFPPILTQNADKQLRMSQIKGMGQPLCQCKRFMAPLESLVAVAEMPQSPGRVCEGSDPGIIPIAIYERPMALGIIQGNRAFEILS